MQTHEEEDFDTAPLRSVRILVSAMHGHVHGHAYLDMRIDMCIDMCMDLHLDMCADMFMVVHVVEHMVVCSGCEYSYAHRSVHRRKLP